MRVIGVRALDLILIYFSGMLDCYRLSYKCLIPTALRLDFIEFRSIILLYVSYRIGYISLLFMSI